MKECLVSGPITAFFTAAEIESAGKMLNAGGHSIFLGQVRNDVIDGKRVKGIEYSAYEPMVSSEAAKIRKEMFDKYSDLCSLLIFHSTGYVAAGEVSLLVFVSAGHREQAIKACREAVELIKERLPVWKKEIYEDTSYSWKENTKIS